MTDIVYWDVLNVGTLHDARSGYWCTLKQNDVALERTLVLR
jgi:hypothetical protein